MKLPVRHALPLAAALLALSAAGGTTAVGKPKPGPAGPVNGPAADFPMVLGDAFVIEGTTYTPADRLNSDEVGYASIGEAGGTGVSGAHKTLPLPSYAEVTSLDSGKTILVRLERRGPMSNDRVIELSPGAAAQLGLSAAAKAPVRVRRVNPPEQERAMLRGGGQAPARMDTPKGLLAALVRKLDAKEGRLTPPPPEPTPTPEAAVATKPQPASELRPASKPQPASKPTPAPEPASASLPTPAPKPAANAASAPTSKPKAKPAEAGNFTVQVATFSTEANAKSAAGKLGGKVSKGGKFWLTRIGPFTTRAEAAAALAKAKAAGYSDARIQRAD